WPRPEGAPRDELLAAVDGGRRVRPCRAKPVAVRTRVVRERAGIDHDRVDTIPELERQCVRMSVRRQERWRRGSAVEREPEIFAPDDDVTGLLEDCRALRGLGQIELRRELQRRVV